MQLANPNFPRVALLLGTTGLLAGLAISFTVTPATSPARSCRCLQLSTAASHPDAGRPPIEVAERSSFEDITVGNHSGSPA